MYGERLVFFNSLAVRMVLRQHSSDLDLRFFSHTSISLARLALSLPSYNKDNTVNWITMPCLLVGNFQIRKHKQTQKELVFFLCDD